jgi:lipid II:glycine glycyltransferase (peptidoglycan interpeptide bridge formation enzyme)
MWSTGIPDSDWDKQLFTSSGHFLQSSSWAAFQQALGRKTFFASSKDWRCLIIVEKSRAGTRLYAPYGPLANNKSGLKAALAAIKALARQEHAIFARLEPLVSFETELAGFGLKPAIKDIQQHQTWVLDITKPQDKLLAEMTPTNRNLWRNYATKGLSIRASNDPVEMKIFIAMMAEVAAHNGIRQHSDHYYQTMADVLLPQKAAKLYIAEHEGKPVASAFCFDSPVTRYYAHAASLFEARKLHPGTPLLAQMIFDAKTNGQTEFDFCGVAPSGAPETHPWAGFTKFKQSFGGSYKQYSGTWELPASPQYLLYRAMYKFSKWFV